MTILNVVTGTIVLPQSGTSYTLEIPSRLAMVQNVGQGQPILCPGQSSITVVNIADMPDFLFGAWQGGQSPSSPAEIYADVYRQGFTYTITGGVDLTVKLYLVFTDDSLYNPIAYASL